MGTNAYHAKTLFLACVGCFAPLTQLRPLKPTATGVKFDIIDGKKAKQPLLI